MESNLFVNKRILTFALFTFFSFSIKAFVFDHYKKDQRKLDEVCLTSPTECLKIVEHDLEHAQSKRVQLDLIQYKLDALFNLQRWQELEETVAPWRDNEEVPPSFRITILIYFAKLNSITQRNDAKLALKKAVDLLEKLQEVYPSPIRLVQLANTLMVMGEHQQAHTLLSDLKSRYGTSNNSYFQLELNGNLGHVTRNMGDLDLSEKHWQETIPWAIKLGNKQQISTVYFNNARLFQLQDKPNQAQANLALALKYAVESKDVVKETQIRLRMAENFHSIERYCDAQAQINLVNTELLTGSYIELHRNLSNTNRC